MPENMFREAVDSHTQCQNQEFFKHTFYKGTSFNAISSDILYFSYGALTPFLKQK